MKPDPVAPHVESPKFPILRECLAEGEVARLFPLMKDWPHHKLNALLAELESADDLSQEAWGELATERSLLIFCRPNRGHQCELRDGKKSGGLVAARGHVEVARE